MRSILVLVSLCAGSAQAQDALEPRDFLDRLEGLTAWFTGARSLVGIEHFNGDDTTTWLRADGSCTQGAITIQNGQVCFTYEDSLDQTYCWLPFIEGDTITVQSANIDDSVQTITRTSRTPLYCRVEGVGM